MELEKREHELTVVTSVMIAVISAVARVTDSSNTSGENTSKVSEDTANDADKGGDEGLCHDQK